MEQQLGRHYVLLILSLMRLKKVWVECEAKVDDGDSDV